MANDAQYGNQQSEQESHTDNNSEMAMGAEPLSALDSKTTNVFAGFIVRKDLANVIKGNALVPSYVLEYLLSKFATTTDQASIDTGVKRVQTILADNYVHREEASLVQSKIRERGSYQIIDRVQVTLNARDNRYEATFSNLGISEVIVDPLTVKNNPKLLVTGIWCMCNIGYDYSEGSKEVPWKLIKLSPVQMSHDDRENFISLRQQFTTREWIDLLMQSIGFDPAMFGERVKLLHLVRLIPFVERNYNLIELGPKGTGKSHIYSEFSPHGILISGGEVTEAKLFVNNSTRQIGLVGYWDAVAFDEFAGKTKRANKALVDIMKNYMANKSFSRGMETLQGEASMVFIGNTTHSVPYMLKNSDLFEELPAQYHDPAFLDRIHFYLPGWEFEQIRSEMFTTGYGFVVDYLAEILHNLRNEDYSGRFEKYFHLSPSLSTRDKDGIRKTFSGLMKLIYPSGEADAKQMEPLLRCAIEGRKRVKDQLCRMDTTMASVDFSYTCVGSSETIPVKTLEEEDYPELYGDNSNADGNAPEPEIPQEKPVYAADSNQTNNSSSHATSTDPEAISKAATNGQSIQSSQRSQKIPEKTTLTAIQRIMAKAKPGRIEFQEDRRGITYNHLFGPYIAGAKEITVKDSYIRTPYQIRNMSEFLETVFNFTERTENVHVHLVTGHDEQEYMDKQIDSLNELQSNFAQLGINLTYDFDTTLHDRSIETDTGWTILPGRGLDIYQPYNDKDWLNPLTRQQKLRRVRAFTVTYIRKSN